MKMAIGTTAVAASLALALTWGQAAYSDDAETSSRFTFVVEGNKVDASTKMGWEVYTGTCMACHGPDGAGSSFAPSLMRAAERRSFDDFARTIAEGLSIRPGMVMPSFADDPRVMSHLKDIWNYLGARTEGGLPRGRPRLMDEYANVQEAEEAD